MQGVRFNTGLELPMKPIKHMPTMVMLDGVPFRALGWVVAHVHRQPLAIAHLLLQLLLETARATPIPAYAIR